MTDPISPAEAAAANAIDANLAAGNADLAGDLVPAGTELPDDASDEQVAEATATAHALEGRLAAIKARKAARAVKAGQAIPHAVPNPQIVGEQPKVEAPQYVLANAEPIASKPVSYSALLQEKLAAGWVPKRYVRPRNRK